MRPKVHGFTLVELLTAMVIMGMISIYVGQILIVNNRAYHNVDQITASQQSLRVIIDVMERDIRHAGMMIPQFAAVCGVDNDTAPDLLYLSDAGAIDPQDDVESYPGARIIGVTNLAVGTITLQLDALVIETSPPARAAYDTDGNGANDSDFQPNAGVIIADAADPDRGVACGRIQSVNLGVDKITVVITTTLADTGNPAQLIAVPAHEYRIDSSRLLWDGMTLSEAIEDLQVSYTFDLNDNDLVDPGETRGDGVGADYGSDDEAANNLRALRVSVVARTTRMDQGITIGRMQPLENRQPVATNDGFRRRVISTSMRLRNVGPMVGVL